MSDLISRQAVKDWLLRWEGCIDKYLIARMQYFVIGIPSAQPDITRCKDCKWFGEAGCAVLIVDDSDKPTEDDYCSFAERREDADQQTGCD